MTGLRRAILSPKMPIVALATCLFGFTQPQFDLSRDEVIQQTMTPYQGPSSRVDRSTMNGKVLCGYQGWFAAEGDGSAMGWFHWGDKNGFGPQKTNIEMWPDVSELDPDERFPTAFRNDDGTPAEVYSAYKPKTVARHFKWMRDYGIDGVFVQRFGVRIQKPVDLNFTNTVLANCRAGANQYGRTYAVMYDLSSLPKGGTQVIIDDWKLLIDKMRITKDPAYLRHKGKPVVAVWGIGFNDARAYTLDECKQLVQFLKSDPRYGGMTVMIGVPTYWRTLNADCVNDPRVHEIARIADVVSPWTVGRFDDSTAVRNYARERLMADIAWCRAAGRELLPVAYPGFSWHNMKPQDRMDKVPRGGGRFLWSQYAEYRKAGATMVYQAMFDEVDEGTAIFKVTPTPPVGSVRFLTFDGPSDMYLWLVGEAAKMYRPGGRVRYSMPRRGTGSG